MTGSSDDLHYHRAVAHEQGIQVEALRMERDELAQRVSELSAALELLREKVEIAEDAAASLLAELDHAKRQNTTLRAQIQRIRETFDN